MPKSNHPLQARIDRIGQEVWGQLSAQGEALIGSLVEKINAELEISGPAGAATILQPIESAMRKIELLDPELNPDAMLEAYAEFWKAVSGEFWPAVRAGMDQATAIAGQGE